MTEPNAVDLLKRARELLVLSGQRFNALGHQSNGIDIFVGVSLTEEAIAEIERRKCEEASR